MKPRWLRVIRENNSNPDFYVQMKKAVHGCYVVQVLGKRRDAMRGEVYDEIFYDRRPEEEAEKIFELKEKEYAKT